MFILLSALDPNVKENAAALDKDPSQLLGNQFNISSINRTIAGHLLKKIYTNTTFEDNIGAFVRVRFFNSIDMEYFNK